MKTRNNHIFSLERLAAIKDRISAATPGPWEWAQDQVNDYLLRQPKPKTMQRYHGFVSWLRGPAKPMIHPVCPWDTCDFHSVYHLNWYSLNEKVICNANPRPQDQEFIAHSRADLQDVVDALERALVYIAELEDRWEHKDDYIP